MTIGNVGPRRGRILRGDFCKAIERAHLRQILRDVRKGSFSEVDARELEGPLFDQMQTFGFPY